MKNLRLYQNRLTSSLRRGILILQIREATKPLLLKGLGQTKSEVTLLREVKKMKKITDVLPGILLGVILGSFYSAQLAAHLPILVILTVVMLFAKFV